MLERDAQKNFEFEGESNSLKILVSAYACEPHKGSEPGVGWNWAQEIARFYDVWVITRANNREAIEEELHKRPAPNLHFHYVDLPTWVSFWKRGQKGIYFYYYLWQVLAYLSARDMHRRIHFDLVHHLTFGNIWMPTLMPLLKIPFIWGPVGGAELVPKKLRGAFPLRWRMYEKIRDFMLLWTLKFDPIAKISMNRASLIIARTAITAIAFPVRYREKIRVMIETGVSPEFLNEMSANRCPNEGLTILTVGRLLHLKGFDLGVEAFSYISHKYPGSKLVIVGSGPEEKYLKKLARKFDQVKNVVFLGHQPRHRVLEFMALADIFLYPSMKEAGAWVIFEAMASGLPIVCLDYSGPAEIVDNDCAVKVRLGSRSEIIKSISDGLDRLLSSKELRTEMGRAARKRLEKYFLWQAKGEMISKAYQEVISTLKAKNN